ncbi:MAG: LptF/LptG family permease [Rhodothermales bacterium]|nr:LptF/LptG family permease [Rhodothermales bacterium]
MKLLHRMILRELPGPFLGWLGTLMFLLLMQFLIRYLPDIAGRGLPFGLIVELIVYNLAYMVVLAVPMSALLASLLVFGRLAESNAYAVIKNSGISLMRLIWPTLAVGGVLALGMNYFNNVVLPEANFRARNLWEDVRTKRPDFELQPGVFYTGISNYAIQVQETLPEQRELRDVIIYDYNDGRRGAVIKARRGQLDPRGTFLDLYLFDGEIHRLRPVAGKDIHERYEVLRFGRYRLRLDLSEFVFERSDPREGYRSDRTTRTAQMVAFVDSLQASIEVRRAGLRQALLALAADSAWQAPATDRPGALPEPAAPDTAAAPGPGRLALAGLSVPQQSAVYVAAGERMRTVRADIEDATRTIGWESQRADRYRVEIHKKYSIALACLIFMLIGAPLGLSIRRGGLGTMGALAVGIFLFYWITLVQGEKLADRDYLEPWFGMWIANILMGIIGLWLVLYVTLDLRATPPLRRRLLDWWRTPRRRG